MITFHFLIHAVVLLLQVAYETSAPDDENVLSLKSWCSFIKFNISMPAFSNDRCIFLFFFQVKSSITWTQWFDG